MTTVEPYPAVRITCAPPLVAGGMRLQISVRNVPIGTTLERLGASSAVSMISEQAEKLEEPHLVDKIYRLACQISELLSGLESTGSEAWYAIAIYATRLNYSFVSPLARNHEYVARIFSSPSEASAVSNVQVEQSEPLLENSHPPKPVTFVLVD